ncbi:carbon-nitrogen hydrolase family protein [Zhengella sp. ZM62]|uniref:carbon-nitrogen hydrolase family protein n=1 Tax=Zhengella sedimenti TaxID=3390035 RepID=UPI003974E6DF
MTRFIAACIQMRSGTDPEENAAAMEAMVREAAAQGARYIQTPEMTGAVQRDRQALFAVLKPEDEDVIAATAARLAGELDIVLHVGSTAIAAAGGKIANRAFLFGPGGERIATYDKIHMFDVDLDNGESWRESSTYTPGGETVIADTGLAKVGLSICYDLRFPQLFRAQALAGAEVLTTPAAFTRQTGEAHWHALIRARAIENGAWVISAAQGGTHADGRETYGHSLVVDPWGRVVADKGDAEPGVLVAEIDTAAVAAARAKIPNLKNARDFSVRTVAAREAEQDA